MNRTLKHLCFAAAALAASVGYCSPLEAARVRNTTASRIPASDPLSDADEHLYAAPTRADRIGRVLAPVTINGQGPFRLIVDTGANQSVLTTKVAAALGLVTEADRPVKINGVTGALLVPTVMVERFETGDLLQEALRLPVVESVMGGADGVLGMQGFADKRITVDFANDRIRVADSRGQRARPPYVRVPVKLRFDRLLLAEGRVGSVKARVVIDTGAERTLGNMALRRELQRRGRVKVPPISTGVIGLSEVEQRGEGIYTRRIRIGDITVTDVTVIYGDIDVFRLWDLQNEPALLIGMDVLGTVHTLVVDYRLQELQIRLRD